GGIPLQIEDRVTGFLVSSAEQCAERAVEILEDPALGKFLGRRGKEHVRAEFLTPRYLRDYLLIFNELRNACAARARRPAASPSRSCWSATAAQSPSMPRARSRGGPGAS